jgi:hypothetical protein
MLLKRYFLEYCYPNMNRKRGIEVDRWFAGMAVYFYLGKYTLFTNLVSSVYFLRLKPKINKE